MTKDRTENKSFILGLLAVSCFSFTLPMCRVAVQDLDPVIVGFGRSLLASFIGLAIIYFKKLPRPKHSDIKPLILVGLGVSVVFPYLTSVAMRHLPASHGAIVTGLLPLATAGWIAWQHHERPSINFWIAAVLGSGTVIGYSLYAGQGIFHWADGLLLLAVVFGGIGYAEGGQLARQRGGLFVMSWALVFMLPILLPVMLFQIKNLPHLVSVSSWGAFLYLTLISQYFGMALWYKALSGGSIARLSQVQLFQPFLTVIVAQIFFQENVMLITYVAAIIVLCCVAISRRSKVVLKE